MKKPITLLVGVLLAIRLTAVAPGSEARAETRSFTTPTSGQGIGYYGLFYTVEPNATATRSSAGDWSLAGTIVVTVRSPISTAKKVCNYSIPNGTAPGRIAIVSACPLGTIEISFPASGDNIVIEKLTQMVNGLILFLPGDLNGPIPTLGYDVVAPVATITAIAPSTDVQAGGVTAVITGTDLDTTTAVTFGGVAATIVNVAAGKVVVTVPPAGVVGTAVDVGVTTSAGIATLSAAFTYYAKPPVIRWAIPSCGLSGGETLSIRGLDFTGVTSVTIGGKAATINKVIPDANGQTLSIVAPSGLTGAQPIVVTTPNGSAQASFSLLYGTCPGVTTPVLTIVSTDPKGGFVTVHWEFTQPNDPRLQNVLGLQWSLTDPKGPWTNIGGTASNISGTFTASGATKQKGPIFVLVVNKDPSAGNASIGAVYQFASPPTAIGADAGNAGSVPPPIALIVPTTTTTPTTTTATTSTTTSTTPTTAATTSTTSTPTTSPPTTSTTSTASTVHPTTPLTVPPTAPLTVPATTQPTASPTTPPTSDATTTSVYTPTTLAPFAGQRTPAEEAQCNPETGLYPAIVGTVGSQIAMVSTEPAGLEVMHFDVTAGVLAPGLVLDEQFGIIFGVPTHAGKYSTTIAATRAHGTIASQEVFTTINNNTEVLSYPVLITGEIGVPMHLGPSTNAAPDATFELLCGEFPAGTTFDQRSGYLVGTPAEQDLLNAPIRIVERSSTGSAVASFVFLVLPKGQARLSYPSQAVMVQGQFSLVQPKVLAARDISYFTLIDGVLADGLTLDPKTGYIAGTPTAVSANDIVIVAAVHSDGSRIAANPMQITVGKQTPTVVHDVGHNRTWLWLVVLVSVLALLALVVLAIVAIRRRRTDDQS